jgi:hypothetical protein
MFRCKAYKKCSKITYFQSFCFGLWHHTFMHVRGPFCGMGGCTYIPCTLIREHVPLEYRECTYIHYTHPFLALVLKTDFSIHFQLAQTGLHSLLPVTDSDWPIVLIPTLCLYNPPTHQLYSLFPLRWRQKVPLKRWYPPTWLYGITNHKNTIWTFTAPKTSTHMRSYTGQTAQVWHPCDQTRAGPENFLNHRWSICYGLKIPK